MVDQSSKVNSENTDGVGGRKANASQLFPRKEQRRNEMTGRRESAILSEREAELSMRGHILWRRNAVQGE
jgi:hypothetical protein